MNNEFLMKASGSLIQAEGQPKKINRIEKSWFWITLISLINLYYTVSATAYYCNMATETNYLALSTGFVFVTAAAGVFIAPFFLKRFGIFDDAQIQDGVLSAVRRRNCGDGFVRGRL